MLNLLHFRFLRLHQDLLLLYSRFNNLSHFSFECENDLRLICDVLLNETLLMVKGFSHEQEVAITSLELFDPHYVNECL